MTSAWRRSRFCDANYCVEVRFGTGVVLMRSSQRPDVVVEFTADEWAAFVKGVRLCAAGRVDVSSDGRRILTDLLAENAARLAANHRGARNTR